jgi:hypothetical protein
MKTGYAGRMQSRILTPFEYDSGNIACADNCVQSEGCSSEDDHDVCPCTGPNASPNGCGWIEISQVTPIDSADEQTKKIFDSLNLYSIFVSDKNINGDLNITARAAKNSDWGGNDKLTYLILDECILYDTQPTGPQLNIFTDGQSKGCSFDISQIRRIDFNVSFPKKYCAPGGGGGGGGPLPPTCLPLIIQKWEFYGDLTAGSKNPVLNPFLQANSNPYASISTAIPIADCAWQPPCDVTCCSAKAANHVRTSINNYFKLKLYVGGYTDVFVLNFTKLSGTPKIIVSMDNKPSQHNPVTIATKIMFNKPISLIKFNGFDFNVSKPGFTNLKIGNAQ